MSEDIRLSIAITKRQYDYVRGIVDDLGISISDYIKILIHQEMKGKDLNGGNLMKNSNNKDSKLLLENNKDKGKEK